MSGKRKKLLTIIVYVILSCIPLTWALGNTYYGRGDVLPFWLSSSTYKESVFLWSNDGGGSPNNRAILAPLLIADLVLRDLFHISIPVTQMLFYSAYTLLSLVFFNKFYNLSFKRKKEINSNIGVVTGSILYNFNLFVLERNFYPTLHWILISLPLFGYYCTLVSRKIATRKDLTLFLIFGSIAIPLLTLNPPEFILLISFCFLLILIEKGLVRKNIYLLTIILILTTLWAYITNYVYIFSQKLNTVTDANQWIWTHRNAKILNILLLKVSWAFESQYYSFVDYFNSSTITAISLLIPTVILIWLIRDKKLGKIELFYTSLLILLILLVKGLNPPLQSLNKTFYSFEYSFLFRESRKFMSIMVLSFLLLYGHAADFLSRKNVAAKKLILITSLLLIAINVYPFVYQPYILSGVNINGLTSETKISTPLYLKKLKEKLESDNIAGRILLLPYSSNYQVRHENGYWGTDELEKRFVSANFIKSPHSYLTQENTKKMIEQLYQNPCNQHLLTLLDIQEILNRKYITPYKDVVIPTNEAILENCPYLNLDESDEKFSIYSVKNYEVSAIQSFNELYLAPQEYIDDTLPEMVKELWDNEYFYVLPDSSQSRSIGPTRQFLSLFSIDKLTTHNINAVKHELVQTLPSTQTAENKFLLFKIDSQEKVDSETEERLFINEKLIENFIPTIDTQNISARPLQLLPGSTLRYVPNDSSLINLIPNPSFENGLWEDKVRDCHNYDDNPDIRMSLAKTHSSEGSQSLELAAEKHFACTRIDINIESGKNYFFGFDYQAESNHPDKKAGIYLEFNDSNKTSISKTLVPEDMSWHEYSQLIESPPDATQIKLYLYAYESNRKKENIARYDNFIFTRVPTISSKYYLAEEKKSNLRQPHTIIVERSNPSKYRLIAKQASTPFYITLSESYHDQWQLMIDNTKIQGPLASWVPWAVPDAIAADQHFKLNTFLNGWYVDINELCQLRQLCQKNPDGSYDLDMVIEFWPQRWFYVGLIISGTTLLGCLSYLGYDGVKKVQQRRRRKRELTTPPYVQSR